MIQTARPYQADALAQIRSHYMDGVRRVLLHLATGGGKTYIFCRVLEGVAKNGKRAIMAVRGKDLVDQASQRLFKEGVEHGCLQGTHWNLKPNAAIQICSVDTLYRRKVAPPADLVVIDEAHLATSDGFLWLATQYPEAFYLPVSATPHVKKGLRHIAERVVYPTTIRSLIADGFLVRPKYYRPSQPDLSEVKIKNGEYDSDGLSEVMVKRAIVGDIVEHYQSLINGLPTVCFTVSKNHSRTMVDAFNSNGIVAEFVDDATKPKERKLALERLEAGETKVICNVGILTTGVDMPFLRAIIMARPTRSYNLYIQMLGRGTRPYRDKTNFIVLDHANNIEEHGFIENERECNLDGVTKSKGEEKPICCKQCYCYFLPSENWQEKNPDKLQTPSRSRRDYDCPECGCDNAPAGGGIRIEETEEGILTEVTPFELEREQYVFDVLRKARMNVERSPEKKWRGWAFFRISDKYGEDYAKTQWRRINKEIPRPAASA